MRHATSINSSTVFFGLENIVSFVRKEFITRLFCATMLFYFKMGGGSWFIELSVKCLNTWKLWRRAISFLTYKVLQITVGNCQQGYAIPALSFIFHQEIIHSLLVPTFPRHLMSDRHWAGGESEEYIQSLSSGGPQPRKEKSLPALTLIFVAPLACW